MQKLVWLLVFVFFSCNQAKKPDKSLTKENEDIIKEATYRYLSDAQTYDFINNYYLARLDSLETGRKIFIHPINKPDFLKEIFRDKAKIYPPEPIVEDTTFAWDAKKLRNVRVILEKELEELKQYQTQKSLYTVFWERKFGNGYIYISRPAYNDYTKKIIVREWIENNDWCGTDKESLLLFTKTESGDWQIN
jgi:hypothetical protein